MAATGLGTILGPANKHAAELYKLKNKEIQQSERDFFYEKGRQSVMAEWKSVSLNTLLTASLVR